MDDNIKKQYKKYRLKYEKRKLARMATSNDKDDINEVNHDIQEYDLIIIGGGTAGLTCATESVKYKKKVAIFNYVEPTLSGTEWGLGGTCLNVGCIPKILFKHAGMIGDILKSDAIHYGWDINRLKNNWGILRRNIQNYIKSQNYKNVTYLNDNGIDYFNQYAKFIDKNTVESKDEDGNLLTFRAKTFIIATGCRPIYPDIVGSEYGITSDDLFSLENSPESTLIVGGSYVALECATMLKALMLPVTVIARSEFLKKFDKEMVHKLIKKLDLDTNTITHTNIVKIELVNNKKRVWYKNKEGENHIDVDTVLFAIGRKANINNMNLEKIGIELNNKIIVNNNNQTTIPNIYAIGDVSNNFELNTIAAQSAKLLMARLYGGSDRYINYSNVPTVVFTLPVEYAFIGLTESVAKDKHAIEVYHEYTDPVEWAAMGMDNTCYIKIICEKTYGKVLGIHIISPNAGEIIQGYGLAINNGLTIHDINSIIGIHPTISETVVGLHITKSSGVNPKKEKC